MNAAEIRAYIEHHADEAERRAKLYDYYKGNHAILRRTVDGNKPNNKIVSAFGTVISNAFCGYMFGTPIAYGGDEALLEYVNSIYDYNDEQAENNSIGLDASICGIGVEILYIDEDGFIRFSRVDPIGCIPIYDNSIEERLVGLIRYYDVYDVLKKRSVRFVEYYDDTVKQVYRMEGTSGAMQKVEESEHGFLDVPAVIYRNNTFMKGDFEGVISQIDAYDSLQSDSVNAQDYFNDAYLVLRGLDGTTDEDISGMQDRRILLLPDNADASWLLKSESDSLIENLKGRIRSDIFKLSGCPDMADENFASNASGVAIRYKLMAFEDIASSKEREFKRGLQRRIELICNILSVLGRGQHDWRSINIMFKRTLPENIQEVATAMSTLGSIISNETKRSMLPMDIDEETEKQRLSEENIAGMALFAGHEEEAEAE